MKSFKPVIGCTAYCLVHAPELVRYGSKPWREIVSDPAFERRLSAALRDFSAAERYAPNQTFIGRQSPEQLAELPRPWFAPPGASVAVETHAGVTPAAPFGEILPQAAFYSLLKRADVLKPPLVEIGAGHAGRIEASIVGHPVAGRLAARDLEPLEPALIATSSQGSAALPLMLDGEIAGLVRRDERAEGRDDENLDARTLLEGLCTKATAAFALEWLLKRARLAPEDIDYVISCGEEAAGDRYQRGGGGMAKAVGEMCGCVNASGMDIKNFCAAPANALVTAGALVATGVYERVAVVAGGSLAKLGMKSQAFIAGGLPILDDCLASHAFLVSRDDGFSPVLHLEPGAIGMASIGASTADEAVYRQLLLEPLDALGLKMTDIDKYAPELHNPEIMEHSGSGDVVRKNYRMIAAMAVRASAIEKAEMQNFIDRIGMPGFAPAQGHIPSGVAYIGHALEALQQGRLRRVMILSKASLFLNRLTELYDGVSFVLEANPKSSLRS